MAKSGDHYHAFDREHTAKAATQAFSLAAPADLVAAEKHRVASSVTMLNDVQFPKLSPENQCHCCGFPYRGPGASRFRLCASSEELAELGLGFPLFFLVLKCLIGMLVLVLCVASLPNLGRNLVIRRQDEFGAKSTIGETSIGSNGKHPSDLPYWPAVMNLIAVIFLCILYVLIWYLVRNSAGKLNSGIDTPSDYAIVFKNLGTDWTEAELKSHIESHMTIYGTTPLIKEISISYGTKQYMQTFKQLMDLNMRYEREKNSGFSKLPKEKPFRCCFCCKSKENDLTEDSYQSKLALLKSQLGELGRTVPKTGIAYVSLKTQFQVTGFLKRWKVRGMKRMLGWGGGGRTFKGRNLRVKRAPEPTDIVWGNLVYSRWSRFVRTAVTTVLLGVILCCSFFILYGIAQWQENLYNQMNTTDKNSDTSDKKSSVEFASIPPAIVIYIFNILLNRTIRLMALFERRHTYTNMLRSTAWKLTVVSALNTLLLPLLTHRDSAKWYTAGGLASNIFWVALSAAFLRPCFTLIGPMFLWKIYRRCDIRRVIERDTAYISQGSANQIYQNTEADIASWYADIMIKFMLCLAYTPLLPLIVPIILLGFVVEYWIDKWILLRRSCRPRLLNEKIALTMIAFVKPGIVLYGVSILIFFSNINSAMRPIGIAAVTVAAVFWFCHSVTFYFYRGAGKDIQRSTEEYDSAVTKFFTVSFTQTYRIANPFTRFESYKHREKHESDKVEFAAGEMDYWTKSYVSNYLGLMSAAHVPVYSMYAQHQPSAPPLESEEPADSADVTVP